MSEGTAVAEGLFAETEDGPRLVCGLCPSCRQQHFPRADICPYCGTAGTGEALAGPEATLWGWTAVTAAPPGYTGEVPYGFGVVELPDGLRVVTRLTEADPTALAFGQPMRLVLVPLRTPGGDRTTWAFTPAGAGAVP